MSTKLRKGTYRVTCLLESILRLCAMRLMGKWGEDKVSPMRFRMGMRFWWLHAWVEDWCIWLLYGTLEPERTNFIPVINAN